jgi:putative transposase
VPAKNALKQFTENSHYHLYNRGVEKRNIFLESQDYLVFISYLKTYLSPKDTNSLSIKLSESKLSWVEKDKILKQLKLNNYHDQVSLLSFCLMPNHVHLLVHQNNTISIQNFAKSLFTRYSMYFNAKNKRVGSLFQGRYKAVAINTDEQLLHVSRYIHRNPTLILQGQNLRDYGYSSYPYYLGIIQADWVKPSMVLSHFSKSGINSYSAFVEDNQLEASSIHQISSLTLDLEY